MPSTCTVAGCAKPASGYSIFCHSHKQTLRRHGDETQDGITVHELAPYVKRIAARHAKNKSSEAWSILRHRWETLTTHAKGILDRHFSGEAGSRVSLSAAAQVRTLAEDATVEAVMHTALAMFLMQEEQPRRFKSDRAFDFQLVRRVRGLSAVNAGEYYDHKIQRTRRVYKDLPPRVVEMLARWLKEAFGAAGVQLAALEQRAAQRQKDEGVKLAAAIKDLE